MGCLETAFVYMSVLAWCVCVYGMDVASTQTHGSLAALLGNALYFETFPRAGGHLSPP